MLPSLVYAVVRLLLDLALLRCHSGPARDVELLFLRHEARVLRRRRQRIAWRPGDRLVLTALSRCLPRAGWHAFPVRPETLLRWHRELIRRKWAAFGRRRGAGRPRLPATSRDLILQLAQENPRWGYQPIRGELLKLGHCISATAIRALLRRHGVPPAPRTRAPAVAGRPARPDRPAGQGKPHVGLPADPRRAAQAGARRVRHRGPDDPAALRRAAGPAPGRLVLARLPPRPRHRRACLRFLHLRDGPATGPVRAVLH